MLTLALYASPIVAFFPRQVALSYPENAKGAPISNSMDALTLIGCLQAPTLFRAGASYLSTSASTFLPTSASKITGSLKNLHLSNAGDRSASMGIWDSLLQRASKGRDYSDLKSGDFPAETAQYALNNEVKSVSKVRRCLTRANWRVGACLFFVLLCSC